MNKSVFNKYLILTLGIEGLLASIREKHDKELNIRRVCNNQFHCKKEWNKIQVCVDLVDCIFIQPLLKDFSKFLTAANGCYVWQ
jgi:hypothetical protein